MRLTTHCLTFRIYGDSRLCSYEPHFATVHKRWPTIAIAGAALSRISKFSDKISYAVDRTHTFSCDVTMSSIQTEKLPELCKSLLYATLSTFTDCVTLLCSETLENRWIAEFMAIVAMIYYSLLISLLNKPGKKQPLHGKTVEYLSMGSECSVCQSSPEVHNTDITIHPRNNVHTRGTITEPRHVDLLTVYYRMSFSSNNNAVLRFGQTMAVIWATRLANTLR
jgi:hypothetical protein